MSKNLRGLSERAGLEQSLYSEIARTGLSEQGRSICYTPGLSDKSLAGDAAITGARSFYDFLRPENSHKKVFVCNGSACLTSGKNAKLKSELLKKFSEKEIGEITCLGHCHSNNYYLFNDEVHHIDTDSNGSSEDGFYTGTNAKNPVFQDDIHDPGEYYSLIKDYGLSRALHEIELSGLRGRGGAGFPFYMKLRTASDSVSDQKYVVCNADEGDPGAYSDKWLLEKRSHSVLFGMMVTGLLTGADTGVIYIRGEYPEAAGKIRKAIEEYDKNILPVLPGKFKFYLFRGAGAYICGEETSLLNSIEGLRPEVRTRPPFPATYGLFGKPTVLSNVETFSNIHYILSSGGKNFASIGTLRSKGTKLVSLDGAFNRPGVYEVEMGTPLDVVIDELGKGTRYPVKAFQIGGPLGGIVPYEMVNTLKVDFESFNEKGYLLGHAGIVSIPSHFPMIEYLLHLFEFAVKESCGKCFPCRLGTDRGHELIRLAVSGGHKIDRELFSDLLETLQSGSLCSLGGGLPLPVRNVTGFFDNELSEFFS